MYTNLLQSIATTIADYRTGAFLPLGPEHVERWITQFNASVRYPMLLELDHILKNTYFSRQRIWNWLNMLTVAPDLVGTSPFQFWSSANMLRLQSGGSSQSDMLTLMEQILGSTLGVRLPNQIIPGSPFIYLDDCLFTGNTTLRNLKAWILNTAPRQFELHAVFIATHSYGEYYLNKQISQLAAQAGKQITLRVWRSEIFEDRKTYTDRAEVLRPTRAAGDSHVDAYVAELTRLNRPPILRAPGAMPVRSVFYSPATRDVLEWELLRAGAALLARCSSSRRGLRPLGYSSLDTLGFGACVVTYRNCPNNVPIALWWGDQSADSGALAWHPLFPRKQMPRILGAGTSLLFLPPQIPAAPQVLRAPAISPFPETSEFSEDDALPSWETDALAALQHVIDSLEFDYEEGLVRAADHEGCVELCSLDELRRHLEEVYNEYWYANVPFDGGEAVFEDNAYDAVQDALSVYSNELERLNWID